MSPLDETLVPAGGEAVAEPASNAKPATDAKPDFAPQEPLFLTFADNALLPSLFGEHDMHLERIEKKLGIQVTSRGNRVALSGKRQAVRAAQAVLESLYHQLERGRDVGEKDVEAALRMVKEREEGVSAGKALEQNSQVLIKTRKKTITPYSNKQAEYIRELLNEEVVFALGPAGTGKTYIAVAAAVSYFIEGKVDRIILSRPAVEAGEKLGFLPGDLKEKIDPYLRPLYDAIQDMLPAEKVLEYMENGTIEIAPLAFMRGRTLSNAYVILDEAQNTTPTQMKMFLTRLGENSRMAITGDLSQTDLPLGMLSGLRDAVDRLKDVEGIGFISFGDKDVVRHPLAARIIKAYEAADKEERRKKHKEKERAKITSMPEQVGE